MARRHPLQDLLRPLLLPVSAMYGWGGRLKRVLYHSNPEKAWAPRAFCVSVGNISWGGTGKTPVVDWLLSWCAAHGKKAAVLTRGYRAHPPQMPFIAHPDGLPEECGDEPLMLAQRHPDALIAVDRRRVRAGRMIETSAEPDIFILDDGFQHLAVRRDADLVLLDCDDLRLKSGNGHAPSNWNMVIPVGTWREPASALSDASAFLVKTNEEEWPSLIPALATRLKEVPRPVFAFRMKPEGLRPLAGAPQTAPEELGKYILATGIGKPEQALGTAFECMGKMPEQTLEFPDHFDFQKARAALERPGLPLVCTGKDAVKIARLRLSVPCYALDAKADFFAALPPSGGKDAELSFSSWWKRRFSARSQRDLAPFTDNHPA